MFPHIKEALPLEAIEKLRVGRFRGGGGRRRLRRRRGSRGRGRKEKRGAERNQKRKAEKNLVCHGVKLVKIEVIEQRRAEDPSARRGYGMFRTGWQFTVAD